MAREPLVLVVEDEFLIAFSTAEMLEARGFAVVTAGSSVDAMRVLDDLNERLAGLFLDVYFRNGATSVEVARAARRRFPDIAVLYASGLSDIGFRDQFVPGSAFLAKPCDMDAVAETLRAMIADSGRQPEARGAEITAGPSRPSRPTRRSIPNARARRDS